MRSFVRVAIVAIAVAHTVSCRQPPAIPYQVPPTIDDGWTIGSPEQAGIDRRRLEAMTGSIHANPAFNVHAVLIEHDGRLVYEEYFSGTDERRGRPLGVVAFTREMKHDIRSITKSVISALVGIAVDSGAIRSLDAPLLDYFPEYADLQVPERRQITLRHALTMSTGFDWNEDVSYRDPQQRRNRDGVERRSAALRSQPSDRCAGRHVVAVRRRNDPTAGRDRAARDETAARRLCAGCALRAARASPTSSGWGASPVCRRRLRDSVSGRAISRNSVRSICTAGSGTDTRWCRAAGLRSRPGGG